MSKLKKALLHGMLAASFFAFPVAGFAVGQDGNGLDMRSESKKEMVPQKDMLNGNGLDMRGEDKKEMTPPKEMTKEPKSEKVASRFGVGVYYGRPYYGRGYYGRGYGGGYYYRPYHRPYYRYNNYYPYRYYGNYGW